MLSTAFSAAALALAASLVSAQTFTDCNPLQKTCPPDPAFGGTFSADFTKGASNLFTGSSLKYDPALGAVFTVNTENDSPTLTSTKYLFFGRVDVEVQVSTGVGVVTSLVLESDDLDEVDWEWLGGDTAQAQTNYFSKGDTSTYDRGTKVPIANPQSSFHTYSIDWTATRLQWLLDGNVVRTLNAADAHGADGYPQTPMQIKLGTWVAGSSKNAQGTIDWAGGLTNFANAPFYGYYRKITITDYSNGVKGASSYEYSDHSGLYTSIKINTGGNVTQNEAVTTSSSSSAAPKTTSSSSKSSTSSSSTTMTTVTSANSTSTTTTKSTSATGSASTTPSSSQTAAPNAAVRTSYSVGALALAVTFLFGYFAM